MYIKFPWREHYREEKQKKRMAKEVSQKSTKSKLIPTNSPHSLIHLVNPASQYDDNSFFSSFHYLSSLIVTLSICEHPASNETEKNIKKTLVDDGIDLSSILFSAIISTDIHVHLTNHIASRFHVKSKLTTHTPKKIRRKLKSLQYHACTLCGIPLCLTKS